MESISDAYVLDNRWDTGKDTLTVKVGCFFCGAESEFDANKCKQFFKCKCGQILRVKV